MIKMAKKLTSNEQIKEILDALETKGYQVSHISTEGLSSWTISAYK